MTGVWDVIALALGVLVVGVLAFFLSPLAVQRDPDMVWEGRVAAGFAALLLGASPPATALARRLQRTARNPSAGADPHRRVAAVQYAANLAWADTDAEPGWELRRTPPLPIRWPPPTDGSAVWLSYAERLGTAGSIELAGPWARITLTADGTAPPTVERLSDAVEPIGLQQAPGNTVRAPQAGLLDAVRRGDPNGVLARALGEWRAHNALIAAHPTVAPHLPPA